MDNKATIDIPSWTEGVVDGTRRVKTCKHVIESLKAQWVYRHESRRKHSKDDCPHCDGSGIIFLDGKEPE